MNIKTFTLTITSLVCASVASIAQQTNETLHLKNGSTFTGIVTTTANGDSLTARNDAGDVLTIARADLSERTPVTADAAKPKGSPKRGFRLFLDGNGFAGGMSVNVDELDESGSWGGFGIEATPGFQFNTHFFMGLGVGIMYACGAKYVDEGYISEYVSEGKYVNIPYRKEIRDAFFVPIHLAFRFDLNPIGKAGKLTPFIDLRGGGQAGKWRGANFNGSVGLRIDRFNASVGYQGIRGDIEQIYGCEAYRFDQNALLFRVGVDFGKRN